MFIRPDVIIGNVGENAVVKGDPVHPVHLKPLGRHLHDHILTALLHHPGKILLQFIGLRRGVQGRIGRLPDDSPRRADKPYLLPRGLQNGLYHVGGSGLPLGSRDADTDHLPCRIPEPGSRQISKRLPPVWNPNHRYILRQSQDPGSDLIQTLLHHQTPAPGTQHLPHKIMGIHLRAFHEHKHTSPGSLPGIVRHLIHFSPRLPQKQIPANPFQTFQHLHAILSNFYNLKQPRNNPSLIHIDPVRRRLLRKSRHGHDGPCKHHHKSRSRGHIGVPDADLKALWPSQLVLIIRQRILSLGHAHRQIPKSHIRDLCQCPLRRRRVADPVSPVDLLCHSGDLILQAHVVGIDGLIMALLCLKGIENLFRQSLAALAALCPNL